MGKGRKRPRKKGTKGHRSKIPAPSPSSRETTKGVSKNTAEGRIKVTNFQLFEEKEVKETPSDRQEENPETRSS